MKSEIKHIHLLGICGTGMASLAGLLKAKGLTVTGTDEAAYPPMSTQLEKMGIKINMGYKPENLNPRPDLVIIGNVIRKDNPEAREVLLNQIPYLSMPQAVSQLFLEDKEPIVVAGTHGKTTTSNLIAWLLEYAKMHPSFLIGGVGLNFGLSYRYSDGKYFVIEGDEYDTAFFDKGSKFLHYKPKNAIISSIEFDHADIFENLERIKDSFVKFIETIPTDGLCVVNADNQNITDILHNAHCKIATYGFSSHAEYQIQLIDTSLSGTKFTLSHAGNKMDFSSPMSGIHNLSNASSALTLLLEMGFSANILREGLEKFKGVKKRQEVKGVSNSITVIDDFAHHPTAIRETIRAMKAQYKGKRIWAIFEPRSNTTRRNIFENEIAASLALADKAIIANVYHSDNIPKNERLNPQNVIDKISIAKKCGNCSFYIPDTNHIIEFVVRNVLPNDVILVMSNGSFDDIHEKLLSGIEKRKFHAVK